MKYWLLTTEYPPFFGGGISTYCFHTAKMLVQNGHLVYVFVNDSAVMNIAIDQKDSLKIIRFNPSRTHSSEFLGHVTNLSYEFAHIVKHFTEKEGPPDIIEAQEYLGIAYYLLQYKHLQYDWCKNIPVIITMHSPSFLSMEYNHMPQYKYPNYWICEMERFVLQAADVLISPSKYILKEVNARFELSNQNIHVIANPYEVESLSKRPNDEGRQQQIIFYGKLTPQKGAFLLLKYFEQLWEKGFSQPLYLIGGQDIVYHPEGRTMGDIIRSRYEKYIDNELLILEDRVRPFELEARLSAAKIVIVPSANDNFPYVVLEIMQLGKILLVSKQGGHAEIVEEGISGFLFDHNKPETFNVQLKKVLQLKEEDKQRIAANAKIRVQELTNLSLIYQQKIAVVNKVIKQIASKNKAFPFIRAVSKIEQVETSSIEPENEHMLSVVVPYYNMGAYINETIHSLMLVEDIDKEIIIINDGSSDIESIKKLEHFRNRKEIKVIDTPNRGLAHARNYGASLAKGKFIAFLDADDIVLPTYYSKAIRVLKAFSNVHFVGCWTRYFEGSTKIWPTFNPEPPVILFHNLVNSSALVYKKDTFLKHGKNDGNMLFNGLEDYDSVLALISGGYGGVVLPEVLFHYRVRKDSMIRAVSKSKKLLLVEYISSKHQACYKKFAPEVFNLQNANGPGISLDNPSLDYHLKDYLPFSMKMSGKIISLIKRNKTFKTIAYKIYKSLKS